MLSIIIRTVQILVFCYADNEAHLKIMFADVFCITQTRIDETDVVCILWMYHDRMEEKKSKGEVTC